ncbi:MAG: hypothetical protein EOM91_10360 [Sphingobacteriia bacterium]|jgi:hypothetical protein|nr:hypothetical protein [Sphingobacteriia bacterium]
MSNDQSHLDGTPRDVLVVPFDIDGNMGGVIRVGSAITYQAAVALVAHCGLMIAPEGEGFDCGSVANPDGHDAFGIAVLI